MFIGSDKIKRITNEDHAEGEIVFVLGIFAVMVLICGVFVAYPIYHVWSQEMSGKADLANAEWSKQIAIEEAKAELESASLNAASEIERAKGVAEANKIIGDSLKGNDAYLRYLWIQGLQDGSSEIIYIPTEANLPILEAGRNIDFGPVLVTAQ